MVKDIQKNIVKTLSSIKDYTFLKEVDIAPLLEDLKKRLDNSPKALSGEWFRLHDLLEGKNRDWQEPFNKLWEYFYNKHNGNEKVVVKLSGIAAGWLMFRVLVEDERTFETQKVMTRQYRLAGK